MTEQCSYTLGTAGFRYDKFKDSFGVFTYKVWNVEIPDFFINIPYSPGLHAQEVIVKFVKMYAKAIQIK